MFNDRQYNINKSKKNNRKGFLILVCFILTTSVGLGYCLSGAVIDRMVNLREDMRPDIATELYYSDGLLLTTLKGSEQYTPVSINEIPKNLKNAFIAAEDTRFYKHFGIDFIAIFRALIANIKARNIVEGGGTITQQLVRNSLVSKKISFIRKLKEQFFAVLIELKYSKDEILEMYMNRIYFGAGAYGVENAAQTYFGKKVKNLNLSESSLIAGITNSPAYYSPFNSLEHAKKRQKIVLDRMVAAGFITQKESEQAKNANLKFIKQIDKYYKKGNYFIDYIVQQLIEEYGAKQVYHDGLKVYTTLDYNMQNAAENAISNNLPVYFKDSAGLCQPQAALLAIEPSTGYIKAMVGGRGTDDYNRSVMAQRQPGSAFKPFVYLTALQNSIYPNTIIEDVPTKFGDYEPHNYDYSFHGKVTVREALYKSLNVATTRLCYDIGVEKILNNAELLGISTIVRIGEANDMNLSSSLGGLTKGVTVMDMTGAYCTFANQGKKIKPMGIIKVEDFSGKILMTYGQKNKQIISKEIISNLVDMMQDVIKIGTGYNASIGRPAAGKTGTTNDNKDAWFIGFTPDLCASVWMGCDSPHKMGNVTGGDVPAIIWKKFMLEALSSLSIKPFSLTYGVKKINNNSQNRELKKVDLAPKDTTSQVLIDTREDNKTKTLQQKEYKEQKNNKEENSPETSHKEIEISDQKEEKPT